jgi:hypothetical protein
MEEHHRYGNHQAHSEDQSQLAIVWHFHGLPLCELRTGPGVRE